MAELKTQRNDASVPDFLAGVADPQRRADAQAACALMTEVTGVQPEMWGTSIVGFGAYHYADGKGRVNDWPAVGLSPRKQSLTLYISGGFDGYGDLLSRLGRHSIGKACLYLPRLSDVDIEVLRQIVGEGFAHLNGRTITPT
jgi:Domain of unknown function (DU1801)